MDATIYDGTIIFLRPKTEIILYFSTHENHFRKIQGRRISPPKGLPVRPTTDMSKEALFNVINNHFSFEGLKILDSQEGKYQL
jgi:hypothetical protein